MKSKPTNKKLKVDVSNLGPPTNADKGTSGGGAASPAGSTSSSASSLLSIGPPSYALSIRPAPETGGVTASTAGSTGSAKSSNSKKGGGGNTKDKDADKGSAASGVGATLPGIPTYPTLTHFNLAEFPKINACIVGNKGGTGSQPATPAAPGTTEANKPIDTLTMEDIDPLQAELETLWSNVATRIRILHREQLNLQSVSGGSSVSHHISIGLEHFDPQHQEKIASVAAIIDHGTRTSVSAAAKLVLGGQLGVGNSPVPSPAPAGQSATSTPSTKRSAAKGERLPKKKLKGEGAGGGKSKKAGGDKPAARATQNRSHSVSSDFGLPAGDGTVKHHEVPAQFWEYIESYCKDLTKDDVDGVRDILEDQSIMATDVFEIPPLGKHFKDEDETAKNKTKESRQNTARDCVGPLTQRLVSALVDERVAMYGNNHLNSPKEDASLATSSGGPEGGYFIQRHGLVKALGLDSGSGRENAPSLESRIRDCLVDHGLLPPDDANDPILLNPDDEMLAEIKRTQSVLKKLHQYNGEKLTGIIDTGKKAMDRYVHRRDLDKADKDLFESYKNLAAQRLKKKPITKKEKDSATKCLETRKRILLKLESIRGHPSNNGLPSRFRNGGGS